MSATQIQTFMNVAIILDDGDVQARSAKCLVMRRDASLRVPVIFSPITERLPPPPPNGKHGDLYFCY